jgi:hypothetical protein
LPSEIAGDIAGHSRAEVGLHPGQRQVDAGRDTGRGEDRAILHPAGLGDHAQLGMAAGQLAAKLAVGGDLLAVQQAGLGEQERADADRAQPLGAWGGGPQPGDQRGVAPFAALDAADHQDRVIGAARRVQPLGRQEGDQAAFALDGQVSPAGGDLDAIDQGSGQAVGGGEHAGRADEVEFVDRWDRGDQHPADRRGLAARARAS